MAKLTSDQKRAKLKKERRARKQQTLEKENRHEYINFRPLDIIFSACKNGGYVDAVEFVNAINKFGIDGTESPLIAETLKHQYYSDIKDKTCHLVKLAEMSSVRTGRSLALAGRLFVPIGKDETPVMFSLPVNIFILSDKLMHEDLGDLVRRLQIECPSVALYFFGLKLGAGVCHFSLVLLETGEYEIYVVTKDDWINIRNRKCFWERIIPLSGFAIRPVQKDPLNVDSITAALFKIKEYHSLPDEDPECVGEFPFGLVNNHVTDILVGVGSSLLTEHDILMCEVLTPHYKNEWLESVSSAVEDKYEPIVVTLKSKIEILEAKIKELQIVPLSIKMPYLPIKSSPPTPSIEEKMSLFFN